MRLLLYIQLKAAKQIRFGNPFSDLIKTHNELMLLDADNHSEALVINHQIQMLKEAKEVILVLDVSPDITPGMTVKLMEKLLRQKDTRLHIFLVGKNAVIEKMLKLSKTEVRSGLGMEELHAAVRNLIS